MSTADGGFAHRREAPRVLWAISHPTLVRAEVPILRQAGLDVVPEEPDPSALRELDFVQYPSDDQYDTVDAPVAPGRCLRLWARGGRVSPAEAAAVNAHYDAIMVATRLDVALTVRRWFRGVVLFRHFGNVPGLPGMDDPPRDPRLLSGIVGVPIFSSLLDSPLGRALPETRLLRTAVPKPPVRTTGLVSPDGDVGIYLGGLGNPTDYLPQIVRLAAAVPDRRIALLGLTETHRAQFEHAARNLLVVPRLGEREYWERFTSLSVMVYPHEDPRHSHYIPFEAISLGIPCLVLERGVAAGEAGIPGTKDGAPSGVFIDWQGLTHELAALLRSPERLTALARAQQPLLGPFSEQTVLRQARQLAELVGSAAPAVRRATADAIYAGGIPSARNLREGMRSGLPEEVGVAAARIAASDDLAKTWSARLVADPADGVLARLETVPGDDLLLKIGAPEGLPADGRRLRVTVHTAEQLDLPAVAEVTRGDDVLSRHPLRRLDAPATGAGGGCAAEVVLTPGQAVRIRVLTALAAPSTTLTRVIVAPTTASAGGDAVGHATARGEDRVPLWTVGRGGARGRLRRRTAGSATGTFWGVRLLRSDLLPGQRLIGNVPAGRRGGSALVLRRTQGGGRTRLAGVVVLGRALHRSAPAVDGQRVLAVGSRRGLLGLGRSTQVPIATMSPRSDQSVGRPGGTEGA